MDHNSVVNQKMAERYLLDELEPELRDKFEEHYFECAECAADVHAGALFVEESKVILAESAESRDQHHVVRTIDVRPVHPASPAYAGLLAWLRPPLAMPVLAVLLLAIGYQFWSYRTLKRAAGTPQVLASAVVNVNVRGTEPIIVSAPVGKAFGLTLNLPPDRNFSSYKLHLYSTQGRLEWSQTTAATGTDSLWVYVPRSNDIPGTLSVYGVTPQGVSEDLGRYPIKLQSPNQ